MPAIHLNQLSFRHSKAVDVLRRVEAHLGTGWTGVVGANGVGKTTLLELINGTLTPTGGSVTVEPVDALVILCDQVVDEATPDVATLAESWEAHDIALRGRLGLAPDDLERWPTLSPGERKRWQVGAALSRRPDILLLDEPTNHLDQSGRDQLVAALKRFDGVGLLVSHDRALLNELTNNTLRLDRGEATLWKAPYDVARQAWEEVEAEQRAGYERLKQEQRNAERRLARERQVNEQKRAAFKRRNNTTSFKDIDGRSAARQNKHREGEKAAGERLANTARVAERAGAAVAATEMRKAIGGEITFDHAPAPKRLLATHSGPLTAGERTLLEDFDLAIERNDRVWIRGANGAGKSTLITALVNDAQLPEDRVLFIRQELGRTDAEDLLDQLTSLDPPTRGRVLAIVAALGVDPELLLASDHPSPGEARKLAIALGLGKQAWLVVLDEPTNHLDLPSIERLERALIAFPGALIVVTHDEVFAGRLGLRPIDLPGG